MTFHEVLLAILRCKFQESLSLKALYSMYETVVNIFDTKDNLDYHQGGLAYEDRRVEILNDLKAEVNKKLAALKA